jgi:hypothetical protein
MTVYSTSAISARVSWPEPIETIWQVLPFHSQSLPSWKRTDLGLSERLFIGAMLSIPKDQRPWGSMNWLAETMQVSRPTLYAIGEWTKSVLLSRPDLETITQEPAFSEEQKTVVVTTNRVKRTALTLALPGGVPDRPAEICLRTAFDEGCSPASLSALSHEAGRRAGEILQEIDHSVLGKVVQARDELFVGRDPILLMVEPHSLAITGLYATADRDAETWGCVLLFTQDRRVQIQGLAEDGCIPYALSCKEAALDAAIQKDVWHPLADVRKVIHDVERETLQKLKVAEKLEKRLRKHWEEPIFAEWAALSEQCDGLLAQIDRLSFWHECLWEAVELVDWRCGEIRTRAINQWLADESLKGIQQLAHPRIVPAVLAQVGGTPGKSTARNADFPGWHCPASGRLASAGGTAFSGSCRSCLLSGQRGPFLAAGACRAAQWPCGVPQSRFGSSAMAGALDRRRSIPPGAG